MSENLRCAIWNTVVSDNPVWDGDVKLVDSPRAGGRYRIADRAILSLEQVPDDERLRARLTSWLIDQRRLGIEIPKITPEIIKDVERFRDLTIDKRADRLLQLIEAQSSNIGSIVAVSGGRSVYALAIAHSESTSIEEVDFLLDYLKNQGWLDTYGSENYILTVEGYAHLADIAQVDTDSSQAFVAMWFDDSLTSAWENGIKLGIQDAGYEPVRIDDKKHNNKIDDEIIAEIRRSCFIVADFTQGDAGARGGVYYEAGFAHGLNLPVIFTCRKDSLQKVHFDTRQYRHIDWETPEELREMLANHISATIGDGPLK